MIPVPPEEVDSLGPNVLAVRPRVVVTAGATRRPPNGFGNTESRSTRYRSTRSASMVPVARRA